MSIGHKVQIVKGFKMCKESSGHWSDLRPRFIRECVKSLLNSINFRFGVSYTEREDENGDMIASMEWTVPYSMLHEYVKKYFDEDKENEY